MKRREYTSKNNLIFRRFLKGSIPLGKYEEVSNIFQKMFSYNWDDEKLLRLKSHTSN